MKKGLTKREKIMLCVGGSLILVSTGAAAYFGYKYVNLKKADADVIEDVRLLKFLTIEGDIIPKALQNAKNKLQRVNSKIEVCYTRLEKHPDDKDTVLLIEKCKKEMNKLIQDISKAEQLQNMLESKEDLYA